ncbi:unnamed protein product, partial [Scytosiphon promiscuus]
RLQPCLPFPYCLLLHVSSAFPVYVEHKNEVDSSYSAVCDVSERVSCSKV